MEKQFILYEVVYEFFNIMYDNFKILNVNRKCCTDLPGNRLILFLNHIRGLRMPDSERSVRRHVHFMNSHITLLHMFQTIIEPNQLHEAKSFLRSWVWPS
jgi:hypothetical protein